MKIALSCLNLFLILTLGANAQEIFVANANTGTIGEYDATTGATIDANLITGLSFPSMIAVSMVFYMSQIITVTRLEV